MADADLIGIYEYTLETWGVDQFQRYRAQINQALERIVNAPYIPTAKAREDLASGCWLYLLSTTSLYIDRDPILLK